MTGDGIWKTDTDITMDHTASAVHGTGAGITVRTGVFLGTDGAAARGDITVSTTHGITEDYMIHGITEAIMIHGTMADIGEVIMPDIGAGTTHGITTIITTAGMTRTTTTVRHIPEVQPTVEIHITD